MVSLLLASISVLHFRKKRKFRNKFKERALLNCNMFLKCVLFTFDLKSLRLSTTIDPLLSKHRKVSSTDSPLKFEIILASGSLESGRFSSRSRVESRAPTWNFLSD